MKSLKRRFTSFKLLNPVVIGSIAALSLVAIPIFLTESEAEFTSSSEAVITVRAQEWIVSSASSSEPRYKSAEVSWTKLPEYSTYTVQTSSDPNFSTFSTVDVTQLSHVVNNLQPSTTYYFRVRPVGSPTGAWFTTSFTTSAWRVLAFGNNEAGQLGDSTRTGSTTPVGSSAIAALPASDIAAGVRHSCAVVNGGAQCWGENLEGQLGTGNLESSLVPQIVPLNGQVTAVAAGEFHSCALANGDVWCWGNNDRGQVGNRSNISSSIPVKVPNLPPGQTTAIDAASGNTCALTGGNLWCWGDNYFSQMGSSLPLVVDAPTRVSGLPAGEVTAISAGFSNTCVVAQGNVWCVGGIDESDSDSNSFDAANYPIRVSGLPAGTITQVATEGYAESSLRCASDGSSLWCWGHNTFGQLGNGNTSTVYNPVKVNSLPAGNISSISNGADTVCAVVNGTPWCWGDNCNGQLGDGTLNDRLFPTKVVNIPEGSVSKVVESTWTFGVGSIHTMVLRN